MTYYYYQIDLIFDNTHYYVTPTVTLSKLVALVVPTFPHSHIHLPTHTHSFPSPTPPHHYGYISSSTLVALVIPEYPEASLLSL